LSGITTSVVLVDLAAALLRELIGVREVACIAAEPQLPIRVSSTTGPSEQPLIFRESLFLCIAAFWDQQKTPGEVLLSRGFSEFLLGAKYRFATVSVSFSWQPFSLLA
jgi:hypothetical protein